MERAEATCIYLLTAAAVDRLVAKPLDKGQFLMICLSYDTTRVVLFDSGASLSFIDESFHKQVRKVESRRCLRMAQSNMSG